MSRLAAFLFISFIALSSYSKDIIIRPSNDQKCSNTPYEQVVDSLLNYEDYKNIDDQIATTVWDLSPVPIPNFGTKLRAIDMVASRIVEPLPLQQEGEVSHAKVYFALAPVGLPEEYIDVYPRLPLQCRSFAYEDKGEDAVFQRCVPAGQMFGLTRFDAKFWLTENGCSQGKLKIDYVISVSTSKNDVDDIKQAIKRHYPVLALISLDRLFDEEKFFRSYFNDLYSLVLKSK